MPNDDLVKKIEEIRISEKEFAITPRVLVNAFGFERRTSNNRLIVNKYREDNQVETDPDYSNAWIDGDIVLRHKKKAKARRTTDSIQRIKLIPAANREPVVVKKESDLSEATTLMRMNSYLQLPVVSGSKQIYGYIIWETIGNGTANGISSDKVLPFASEEIAVLDYETPLLEAIGTVIKREFAVVQKEDNFRNRYIGRC